jgi:hypothetical protein
MHQYELADPVDSGIDVGQGTNEGCLEYLSKRINVGHYKFINSTIIKT